MPACPFIRHDPTFSRNHQPACRRAQPGLRTPITTYQWQTLSGVPDPAEFRFILLAGNEILADDYPTIEDYIRNNPDAPQWSPWQAYGPSTTSWTTPPLDFGPYVFAVQGRDADGNRCDEFTLERNMRRVRVAPKKSGALLTVTSDLLSEPVISATLYAAPVIIHVPAGTPIQFCWNVDASRWGVDGFYRYGWDIPDIFDDVAWQIDWIPVEPTDWVCGPVLMFFFGTHTYLIEAMDSTGYLTLVQIIINVTNPAPVEATTWGAVKALYGE